MRNEGANDVAGFVRHEVSIGAPGIPGEGASKDLLRAQQLNVTKSSA